MKTIYNPDLEYNKTNGIDDWVYKEYEEYCWEYFDGNDEWHRLHKPAIEWDNGRIDIFIMGNNIGWMDINQNLKIILSWIKNIREKTIGTIRMLLNIISGKKS